MEICFILTEPAVPENIGAAARAIKTMGFNQLRLVNPCNHLSDNARKLAHASCEILESAAVFQDLQSAIADLDFTVASSAKRRSVRQNYIPANELVDFLKDKKSVVSKLGVVFGREESGLTNDELKMCDVVSYVPMVQKYPSLNLGQAVMLFAYELSVLHITLKKKQHKSASAESFRSMSKRFDRLLEVADIAQNEPVANRIAERIRHLAEDDLFMAHAVTLALLKRIENRDTEI
jgi:tRNA/rRNA methyltransferase